MASILSCQGTVNVCATASITINISKNGFGFLTMEMSTKGQDILVINTDVPNVSGRKARVMWVKKGPAHYQVAVEFVTV
jgi:PilZ domain